MISICSRLASLLFIILGGGIAEHHQLRDYMLKLLTLYDGRCLTENAFCACLLRGEAEPYTDCTLSGA